MTRMLWKLDKFMKTISMMPIGEGALVDTRAICRDPNWQVRVCMHYDALPLRPLPTGIKVAYVERIRRGEKTILKIFHPKIDSMKDIPMWDWPAVTEMSAMPVAIVNFLEPTEFRTLHECMPEFPCRICKLRDQEKHDVCAQCNRILSYFIGKCSKELPKIPIMKIREQLVVKLGEVKIDEYPKNI